MPLIREDSGRARLPVGRWVGIAVLVSEVLAARGARAQGRDLCLGPYEQGQELRRQGRLRAARDVFRTCSRDECPSAARLDCSTWGAEVASALPTVLVSARDAEGRDVTGLVVSVDGEQVSGYEDGRAFEVDPGPHTLRFEARGHVVGLEVVAREGEKRRLLSVTFPALTPPKSAPAAVERRSRPVPRSVWALGGLGVLGLGSFVTLDALGWATHNSLRHTCAPFCLDDQVRPVRIEYAIGDVSLAVSVLSLGVATWLFLSRPVHDGGSAPKPPTVRAPLVWFR
jgi:hypothetical protein